MEQRNRNTVGPLIQADMDKSIESADGPGSKLIRYRANYSR